MVLKVMAVVQEEVKKLVAGETRKLFNIFIIVLDPSAINLERGQRLYWRSMKIPSCPPQRIVRVQKWDKFLEKGGERAWIVEQGKKEKELSKF